MPGGFYGRCRARLASAFRERHILIRDGDTIWTFYLTPARLKVLAGASFATAIAVLTISGGLFWQGEILEMRASHMDSVKSAHDELKGELNVLRQNAHAVSVQLTAAAPPGIGKPLYPNTSDIESIRTDLQRIIERRDLLDRRLARSKSQQDVLLKEVAKLRQRQADIKAELTETRKNLRDVTSGRASLGDRLAETLSDLYSVRTKRQAALHREAEAEDKAAHLEAQLERAQADEAALESKVVSLREQVEETRAARDELLAERKQLSQRVGRLEQNLGQVTNSGKDDLLQRIGKLEDALVMAEAESSSYKRERKTLQERVKTLESRLQSVQKQQRGLFNHYVTQATASLTAVEKTVAMTGLDVDAMVQKGRHHAERNTGGPFVPVSGADGLLGPSARKLDRKMQRLRILQEVLSSLPLTPPLDAYWISSYYGKRRDPYNGRWAMHEGLDLAGQSGLKVRAAAPGKVIDVGWQGGYGRIVTIDHGFGIETHYAHMKSTSVQKGDEVGHRGPIGKLGNTGRSTGPHVHYEIRVDEKPVDPMNFLKAGKHVFKK